MNTPETTWNAVDDYFNGLFSPYDPVLDAALTDSTAAGLPAISVSPAQGKLLMILARAMQARSILEVGTLGGFSAIWLARGLAPGGRLITLEYEQKHATVAQANIDRAGFSDRVEVRLGSAHDTLPQLVAEHAGPFDLIFIDADKPGYADYFRESMKLARPGTLIIADNVVRKGEIVDTASTDPMVQGIQRFNAAVVAEPRVTATALQTVGPKGYDGFAFILVNE